MGIVLKVGSYVRVIGSVAVVNVFRQAREWHGIAGLLGIAGVGEINQGIVAAHVIQIFQSRESRIGKVFLIGAPGKSTRNEVSREIVYVVAGCGLVVSSYGLAGDQPHQCRERIVLLGI